MLQLNGRKSCVCKSRARFILWYNLLCVHVSYQHLIKNKKEFIKLESNKVPLHMSKAAPLNLNTSLDFCVSSSRSFIRNSIYFVGVALVDYISLSSLFLRKARFILQGIPYY